MAITPKNQRTAPPETINIRGARPTSGNAIISRFLEPLIITQAAKQLLKAGFSKNSAEWKKYEEEFNIEPVTGLDGQVIQPGDYSWWFGTPILDVLVMSYEAYTDDRGNTVPAGGIALQNIMLTVSQPKIIERTRISGHRGRVKQFIGDDDFEIQAIGKIIAPPEGVNKWYSLNGVTIKPKGEFKQGHRPTEEIMQLVRLLKAQIEVEVSSPFLNLFDINRCVMGPYSFPNEEGRLDNQLVKFTMWSDEDFDVTTGAILP